MTGLKQQGAIEAFLRAHDLPKHDLDHATVAERVGIVRFHLDGALVHLERLLVLSHMHEGVAEIGQRDREVGLQRDCPLLAPPRLFVIAEVEMHGCEVVMGIVQARIERDHALQQLFRLLEAPAVMGAHTEQMDSVDVIRKGLQYLTAQRLGLGISALAIGVRRRGDDGVGLLHQFLLQSRVLECARAAAAVLQGVSPEDALGRV